MTTEFIFEMTHLRTGRSPAGNKLYNNWGFRSDNKVSQPVPAALRLDREEARNPQLYIVSYVIGHAMATTPTVQIQ
ncbi:MAG TPA: hypothetical protein VIK55_21175 [Paludibacter sp.]